MENVIEDSSGQEGHTPVDEEMSFLTYLLRGFIFPCGSLNFYKAAIKKKVFWAIVFFIIFGLVFSTVQTATSMINMKEMGTFIIESLHNGDVPEMIIHNGVAEVYAEQPVWYEDEVRYIGADTTGQFTVEELLTYDEGVLLVRDTIYVWDDGKLKDLSLRDMNDVFGDPLYFDEQHVTDFWQSFSRIMGFVIFFALWFWHAGIRLVYILVVALVLWGIISLSKNDVGFGLVLISGIFANVPVMYIKTVLKMMNVSFFLLYTLLLLTFWGIVLAKMLKKEPRKTEPALVSAAGQTTLEQIDYSHIVDNDPE
jgi:hypothetical protein